MFISVEKSYHDNPCKFGQYTGRNKLSAQDGKIYSFEYNLLKLKCFLHTGVTRNNWLLSSRNGETRILGSVKINSLQMKLNIKRRSCTVSRACAKQDCLPVNFTQYCSLSK